MINPLLEILKELHGEEISFKDGQVYYVHFKDGLFSVYLDQDEKEIKVNVEFLPEEHTYIYHSDKHLENLLDI